MGVTGGRVVWEEPTGHSEPAGRRMPAGNLLHQEWCALQQAQGANWLSVQSFEAVRQIAHILPGPMRDRQPPN